jgi:hypothetical protein
MIRKNDAMVSGDNGRGIAGSRITTTSLVDTQPGVDKLPTVRRIGEDSGL